MAVIHRGAWQHSARWDRGRELQYGDFCRNWDANASLRSDCADLACQMIIDFASDRGLPVIFSNGHELFESKSFEGSKWVFRNFVQRNIGAIHLNFPTNTTLVGRNHSQAKVGDILLHYLGGGRAYHTQVVVGSSSNGRQLDIIQGQPGLLMFTLGTSPGMGSYRVVPRLQRSYYDFNTGAYYNGTTEEVTPIKELWSTIEIRRWHFAAWNQA